MFPLKKNLGVLEFVVFGALAFLFAAAPAYNDNAEMQFTFFFATRLVASFALLVVAYSLFLLGCCAAVKANAGRSTSKKRIDVDRRPRSIIFVALLMVACWVPYGICLYPGVSFFDTAFQLVQFFGDPSPGIFPMIEGASYTDHHPFFDTMLFGFFVKTGADFFSANVGMFSYLVVQAVLTALSFAYGIAYIRSVLGVPRCVCFVAIGFFAICPIVPVFVFSMTKDSLFSWLYVLFFIQSIDIIRTRGKMLMTRKGFITVLLVVVLLGLTKKTGVYVVLLSFAVFCFFAKGQWKKLLSAALLPLLITAFALPMLIFPVLNVSSGSKVEMLGFFYQQTARYVVDYPDDVTQDEQEAISEVLDYEHLAERYSPGITNPIKDVGTGANHWPSISQIIDYAVCYVVEGLKHPDAYFNAIASLEAGWFDWSDVIKLPTEAGMPRSILTGDPDIYRPASVQVFADGLDDVLEFFADFFPTSLLLRMPFYAVVIPVFATLFLRKEKSSLLPAMIPIWASFLLLVVSPVSMVTNFEAQRYLLPFVYSAPLVLMLCFSRLGDGKDGRSVGVGVIEGCGCSGRTRRRAIFQKD